MKTIKFLSRQVYETEGPNKGPVFEEGKSYKLDDDKADRWLRRGVAEEVAGRQTAAPTPTPTPAATPPAKALADHTIEELREIAEKEAIDLTGASLKDDIVGKIEAARTSKASA